MVGKVFIYDIDNNRIQLNIPELTLIKEFSKLLDPKRNKCKEDLKGTKALRAFKEFTYIWLMLDWMSLYAEYNEQERHELALEDSGLTEDEYNDPEFRAACRKYREIQESSRSVKLLQAAQETVDKFIDYFTIIVDLNDRDSNGKPIFKVKDIIAEISSLTKVLEELKALEAQVKSEITERSTVRAGAIVGYTPNF